MDLERRSVGGAFSRTTLMAVVERALLVIMVILLCASRQAFATPTPTPTLTPSPTNTSAPTPTGAIRRSVDSRADTVYWDGAICKQSSDRDTVNSVPLPASATCTAVGGSGSFSHWLGTGFTGGQVAFKVSVVSKAGTPSGTDSYSFACFMTDGAVIISAAYGTPVTANAVLTGQARFMPVTASTGLMSCGGSCTYGGDCTVYATVTVTGVDAEPRSTVIQHVKTSVMTTPGDPS